MIEKNVDSLTLEEVYQKLNSVMNHVVNGDSDKYDDNVLSSTLDLLRVCKQRVSNEGLFSKNEEMDDIMTSSIKVYLLASNSTPLMSHFCSTCTWITLSENVIFRVVT